MRRISSIPELRAAYTSSNLARVLQHPAFQTVRTTADPVTDRRRSAMVQSVTSMASEYVGEKGLSLWQTVASRSVELMGERGAIASQGLIKLCKARKEGRIAFDCIGTMARLCGVDPYRIFNSGSLDLANKQVPPKHIMDTAYGAAVEIDACLHLVERRGPKVHTGTKISMNRVPVAEFDAWTYDEAENTMSIYEIKYRFDQGSLLEQMLGLSPSGSRKQKKHCQLEVFANPERYDASEFLRNAIASINNGRVKFIYLFDNYAKSDLQREIRRGSNLRAILSRIIRDPSKDPGPVKQEAIDLFDRLETERSGILTRLEFYSMKYYTQPIEGARHCGV